MATRKKVRLTIVAKGGIGKGERGSRVNVPLKRERAVRNNGVRSIGRGEKTTEEVEEAAIAMCEGDEDYKSEAKTRGHTQWKN